eukprot:6191851-Pleurochrysis_carterae.AAC.5
MPAGASASCCSAATAACPARPREFVPVELGARTYQETVWPDTYRIHILMIQYVSALLAGTAPRNSMRRVAGIQTGRVPVRCIVNTFGDAMRNAVSNLGYTASTQNLNWARVPFIFTATPAGAKRTPAASARRLILFRHHTVLMRVPYSYCNLSHQ